MCVETVLEVCVCACVLKLLLKCVRMLENLLNIVRRNLLKALVEIFEAVVHRALVPFLVTCFGRKIELLIVFGFLSLQVHKKVPAAVTS